MSGADLGELAVELFLVHRRKKTVAKQLNERGLTTTTGRPFSDVAVHRVLAFHAKDFPENPLPPETRAELRRLLAQPRAKQPKHLLAGILKCECGQAMYVGSRSKKYSCKRCNTAITIHAAENVAATSICEILDLDQSWRDLPPTTKRQIVETAIERMTLEEGNIIKIRWQDMAA